MKKIITILTILISLTLNAQFLYKSTEDVELKFSVLLNDKSIETDKVVLMLCNETLKINEDYITNNNFSLFLKKGFMYSIIIGYENHNYRCVMINTKCPPKTKFLVNITMRLYENGIDDLAGYLYYDDNEDNFISK